MATTYTKSGTKATTSVKLDKDIFDLEVNNHDLLKAAYVAYLANGRGNSAVTKTRGLISGGGRKPWKQKGTGRARFGSSRNPIWRGGGIVFGPTGNENYSHKISPADKKLALKQALSLMNQEKKVSIVESIEVKDGKVKSANALLSKLGANGNILIVVDDIDKSLLLSTRNLANVKVLQAKYLNAYTVLNSDSILLSKPAVAVINEWLKTAKKGDK